MGKSKEMKYEEWYFIDTPIDKKIKCECGVSITLGKDDHPEFHSEYCEIKKKYISKPTELTDLPKGWEVF